MVNWARNRENHETNPLQVANCQMQAIKPTYQILASTHENYKTTDQQQQLSDILDVLPIRRLCNQISNIIVLMRKENHFIMKVCETETK